jgi:cellulose synthase/poly-beta-1,6-N-acetylglucosamine synthase-like glycosyltransferase
MDKRSITVIIPTVNESTLEQVVQAARQELPAAEIIVVGYGPAWDIAERNSVDFLDMEHKTVKPIGINRAIRLAGNEWLIVLDADAIPLQGWGQAMLTAFQEGKQVFHGSLNMSSGNYWMRVYNLSSFHEILPENKSGKRNHLPACNLGFTKEAYKIGGDWDEQLARSQDYEWTLRLHQKGISLWFDSKPSILHIPRGQSTFMAVWTSWVRNGYYNWLVRQKYRDTLKTPGVLHYPILILLFAPLLSIVPTLRIASTSPKNFIRYFYLLPFVYLTKIAWCWGVYKAARKSKGFTNNGSAR